MIETRYVGHQARTGAVLGLTAEGLIHGAAVKRLPLSERWSLEGWEQLRGVPWDVKAQRGPREAPPAAAAPAAVALPAQQQQRKEPRAFYVKKADVQKYGGTAGCAGCQAIAMGRGAQTHSAACRERIMKAIEESDQERMQAFRERVEARKAEAGAQTEAEPAAQGAELDPGGERGGADQEMVRQPVPEPGTPGRRPEAATRPAPGESPGSPEEQEGPEVGEGAWLRAVQEEARGSRR